MSEDCPAGDDRREFVRIADVIGIEASLVPEEGRADVRARELLPSAPQETVVAEGYETEESRVIRYLEAINSKLDLLVRHLVTEQAGVRELESQRVTLSGGGIEFRMKQAPNLRDIVELKTVLPGPPPLWLCLYVEVVRVTPPDMEGHHSVAGRFIGMDEDIQEHLMRHIFERQREEIRRRRQQEQS